MIPHLFFYQLIVLGLLWLFVMRSMAWPSPGVVSQQRPATPMTPSGKPSKDPTPFPGLTRKPHCVACAQWITQPQLPPPLPPAPMPVPNRRPRQVDTSRHFCPHAPCAYQGW
jgi:hypothetical protein